MPLITIDHFADLNTESKRRVQERCAQVVMESMAAPASNVRIFLRSFTQEDVYVASGAHERGLPVVRVEFLPGRTLEQKRALVKGLAEAVSEELSASADGIRIVLFERQKDEWGRGATLVMDL